MTLTAPAGNASQLFTVNLATGTATLVGTIGGGVPLNALTVIPTAVPEPSLIGLGLIGFGIVAVTSRRFTLRSMLTTRARRPNMQNATVSKTVVS